MSRIRVLVVDDSALVRKTVCQLIDADPRLEVAGTAAHGREALDRVVQLRPDVVTLDLHMPVMDGMTCLSHLIRDHQQRVVILSTLAEENSFSTFKALALGAVDFVTKPGSGRYLTTLQELGRSLRAKIVAAAAVPAEKVGRRLPPRTHPPVKQFVPSAAPHFPVAASRSGASTVHGARSAMSGKEGTVRSRRRCLPALRVVGIGGSTGGTVGLETILKGLPIGSSCCPVIVQHVPRGFSASLARYLDSVCHFDVKVAEDREPLLPGTAYLAPDDVHLRVQAHAGGLRHRLDPASRAEHGFRPSINTLFYSIAGLRARRVVAMLLSGMGDDGVHGLLAIKERGGRTLVQDEDSSVVFGMAARAIELGAVTESLPVRELAGALTPGLRGVA